MDAPASTILIWWTQERPCRGQARRPAMIKVKRKKSYPIKILSLINLKMIETSLQPAIRRIINIILIRKVGNGVNILPGVL